MKFEIKGKCTKLTIQPPPKGGDRIESIRGCEIVEIGEGLLGKAALRDIPHDMANALAKGMTVGRRYAITIEIQAVPDPQLSLPLGDEDDDADGFALGSGDSAAPTATITTADGTAPLGSKSGNALLAGVVARAAKPTTKAPRGFGSRPPRGAH